MKTGKFIVAGFVFLLPLLVVRSAEIAWPGGRCQVANDGTIRLIGKDGRSVELAACMVFPKWRFCFHPGSGIQVRQPGADTILAEGQWRIGQESCPFSGKLSVAEGKLRIAFQATVPESWKTQDDQSMLIVVRGNFDDGLTGRFQLGKTVTQFGRTNVWGNGDTLKLGPYDLEVFFGPGVRTFSFWSSTAQKNWSIRSNTDFRSREGKRVYYADLTIHSAVLNIVAPVNNTQIKQTQYLRLLTPPSEPLFLPQKILNFLQQTDITEKEIEQVEDLLDARSRLYSWLDRWQHSSARDPGIFRLLQRGYQALNAMNSEALNRSLDALRDAEGNLPEEEYPLTVFNPFTWIKSFTIWGFKKHPDGMSVYEPNPFCILWQDGFRFRIFQDKSVTTAATDNSDPTWLETRFSRPLPVSVERSWTKSVWKRDNCSVTFSVLTPLIDVDGVDVLELGDFRVPPVRLEFMTPNGLSCTIPLIKGAKQISEVVASALMDHNSREKVRQFADGDGEKQLDPMYVARPWLRLTFADGDNLILLPGARPVAAGFSRGVFTLKLQKKSYIALLRMPSNLHFRELPQIAEFFAAVAVAPPGECFGRVGEGKAIWRYQHRIRPNAWNLPPHRIAPVPPLAVLAGVLPDGVKKIKYSTRYGLFHFMEGDSVELPLPEPDPAFPLFRGINGYLTENELIRKFSESGVDWIRLCLGKRLSPEETYAAYEQLLRSGTEKGWKFLVDPHNFQYEVNWSGGFPEGPEEEQKFLTLWDRLSKVGAKYPQAVAGYDLYNELGVREGAEMHWKELAGKAVAIIRKNHPDARIYMTGMCGANPNGLFNFLPVEGKNLAASFHFYTPHSFTHQKTQSMKPQDTTLFYPGYLPPIDWKKGIHYGGTCVEWFDKWQLGAAMLPAFELFAERRLPLHCGEFAVVGYANRKAPWSAFWWTRDTVELLEHARISWNLWHMGFGIGNKQVVEYLSERWKKN